ncbi:MAG: hypothetical protein WAL63_19145 [Solirubrobacteraceae bacterium]
MVVDRPADAGGGWSRVRVRVGGGFDGDPAVFRDVSYDVEVAGEASREQLDELVSHVDAIAEIPNSVRRGTPVKLRHVEIAPS